MRRVYFAAWILLGCFSCMEVCRAQEVQPFFGYNLNRQPVRNLANPGTKLIVLFFTATDCPISNRYIPEIQRLESKFVAQHVMFWYVYPNAGESEVGIRRHERDFGSEQHVLLDPGHRLVDFTRARITPEAAVLLPTGDSAVLRVLYHGRIDNRYIEIGLQRPSATRHDLEQAIVDVLDHQLVQPPDGPPVGCAIAGKP